MTEITVGLVQHSCSDQRLENLRASIDGIHAARRKGADLVLLPELHTGPYFCQVEDPCRFDRAEPIPGPTTEELAAVCRELAVVVVASVFEKRAAGLYHNTAVVLERDGTIAGCYRKMHIPDDPGYFEKYYFTPGDLGFQPIATSVGTLGVLVCWDQWFPEAARLMALAGADLLLYPTAIGWDQADPPSERTRQLEAWHTVQRSHAIANGIPVLSANRVGYERAAEAAEEGISFWGSSFIAGGQGQILAQAPQDEAAVLTATLDRGEREQLRRTWPFLRDRRVDAYGDLLRRYCDRPPGK